MPVGSTIAAICCAPGVSPRSMIRVSGPDVRECAHSCCDRTLDKRGVRTARFDLGDGYSFPVLLAWYPGPNSYTGEDTTEVMMPGNRALLQRVLDRLLGCSGVVLAGPGEFSARAYLNHRLTLPQAEGIALRIAAERDDELAAAGSLLDGSYGEQCNEWAFEITTLLALVEAGVDFSDQEDVIPIAPSDLHNRLGVVLGSINDQIGTRSGDRVQTDLPTVVFVGSPNAGKSSLFNTMLGVRRAVVSDQAGTTRDAIRECFDLSKHVPGAGRVELTDLAGLGDRAIDAIDADAQDRARRAIATSSVVLWCDPDGRFDESSIVLPAGVPVVRVRTKSDLPAPAAISDAIAVCALDGSAISTLYRAIADAVSDRSEPGRGGGVGVFVPRHRRALIDSAHGIRDGLSRIDPSCRIIEEPELIAIGLRDALDALGELIGEVTPDDVLGRVFATFCVGK